MTIRDGANWILDRQLWQAIMFLCVWVILIAIVQASREDRQP